MPVYYLVYINEMVIQLHSDDDVSAMETQVHPNLLNIQRICAATKNPGKYPNCQNLLTFNFYWQLSHGCILITNFAYRYSYVMYISVLWL